MLNKEPKLRITSKKAADHKFFKCLIDAEFDEPMELEDTDKVGLQ